jgi:hypothetical protein
LPGVETHWLVRETDVQVDDLQPGTQARIRGNLVVEDVDQAEHLISEYEQQVKEEAEALQARGAASTSSSGDSKSASKDSGKASTSSSATKSAKEEKQ